MYVVRFDWDRYNVNKLAAHGVSPAEFEQAFSNRRVVRQKPVDIERRKIAAGQTDDGRVLALVYTMRRGKVRAITAYEWRRQGGNKWQPKPQ
jgi:uncharacterized DUF497 family protein